MYKVLPEGQEEPEFWEHLGGKPRRIDTHDSVLSDVEAEKTAILDLYEIKELCGIGVFFLRLCFSQVFQLFVIPCFSSKRSDRHRDFV